MQYFSKTFILLFLLNLVFGEVNAQDVLDQVSEETCTCLNEKLPDGAVDESKIEMVLGLCMMQASGKYKTELEEDYDLPMNTSENFEKLGEIVGERMAEDCDKFMEIILVLVGDEDSDMHQGLLEDLDEKGKVLGKVTKVEEGDFLSLHIKEKGQKIEVMCLRSFEGVDLVKLEGAKYLVGKKVAVSYREIELYSPNMKGFYSVKELRSIRLAD